MIELSLCPDCGSSAHTPLLSAPDRLKRVGGVFHLVRCLACGFAYLNPRIPPAELLTIAPEGCGPALNRPAQRSAFHGGRLLSEAARWALARDLGYRHLGGRRPNAVSRILALIRRPRLAAKFPPFLGEGRLLDVGCWTGGFLERMAEVGWHVTGIELHPQAAELAREATKEIFVGDLMAAPFPDGAFDLVAAFHILEHLHDPQSALRRIVRWLAPGGRAVVEVPNFDSLGRRLFGADWYGLDLPFHLSHFTLESLGRFVERAGGRIVEVRHFSDPHYITKSLESQADNANGRRGVARAWLSFFQSSPGRRLLKLGLWAACRAGAGEAIRVTIAPAGSSSVAV